MIWFINPAAGWWPLLLCLLPVGYRLFSNRFPISQTGYELPVIVFITTALVGVWAAYDQTAAWNKFWVILGAIAIYYALARQAKNNLWRVAALLAFTSAVLSIIFILFSSWYSNNADLEIINRIGLWRQAYFPLPSFSFLDRDSTEGLLAVLFPIIIAYGIHAWVNRNRSGLLFGSIAAAVVALGIFYSSSRAAWISLAGGLVFLCIWKLALFTARRSRFPTDRIIVSALLLTGISLAVFLWLFSGTVTDLITPIFGQANGIDRITIARNSLQLVSDFPFTGGGLASFPGLYSQYLLVIPSAFFYTSHNLYLDVLVEQGFFGGISALILICGGIWVLGKRLLQPEDNFQTYGLAEAVMVSLWVMVFHGFLDDPLYGYQGTSFLFALPGLAIALSLPEKRKGAEQKQSHRVYGKPGFFTRLTRRKYAGSFLGGIIILSILLIGPGKLMSQWFANVGAVEMARVELAGFPTGQWEKGQYAAPLAVSKKRFLSALDLNPQNSSALYRLGLIAMQNRDYPSAIPYLETAYREDQAHPGIRKTLGYSYVWNGQLDLALSLLQTVPEARTEMGVYVGWWKSLGEDELSLRAAAMVSRLEQETSSSGD